MPKISDLNVKLNVSATFPTSHPYRDALYVALGEVEMLRARVAELDEYVQHSISDDEAQKVYNGARDEGFELGMQRGLEEAARRAHESSQCDAKVGHDEYGRRAPDMAGVDEWVGVPLGGTSPVTGRMRTGDPEVDNLTGIPNHARQVIERLARQLADEREGMRRAREEVAVLNARCADYAGVIKELQAQHDDRMAYQDEVVKLRAEVVRLSAPTPATQYISVITPQDLQGAYNRGVEEGRAAALAESEKMAHDITPAAAAIAQERAIQRAKYTHAHDRRHTGVMWLSLINEAVNRHSVRDWPRTFRVVGALALAALDVLTAEGADYMGPVRKKELTTDHASSDGSCAPPETDHAAEGLAHQPSPTVPMTVDADDVPTVPDPVYPERTRHLAEGEVVVTRRDALIGSRVVRGAIDVTVVAAGDKRNVAIRLHDGWTGFMPRENLIPTT